MLNRHKFLIIMGIILISYFSFNLGRSVERADEINYKSPPYAENLKIINNQFSDGNYMCIKEIFITKVVGKSMEPTTFGGYITIAKEINDLNSLRIGDIIIFRYSQSDLIIPVTHRIIEIGYDNQGRYFITQGDNNLESDGKIRDNQIIGVVVGVLY